MDNLSNRFRKVMMAFLISLILLISYLSFYYVLKGEKVISSTYNSRLWLERNKILRGNIYDRDMNLLTESQRLEDGSQKLIYHGGSEFAHVLGYMHPKYGLTGLQSMYDAELMGKSKGGAAPVKSTGRKEGYDLKTTMNTELQKTAFNALGNEKGSVVVLDAKSSEILTMVSKPSYNPNNLDENWADISTNQNSTLLNRAVSGLYTPGSVFKVITEAAALENIPDVLNKRINDEGALYYDGTKLLPNIGGRALGNIGLKEALTYSSNVYFGQLALDMGNDKLKGMSERFLFNNAIPADGIIIDNSKFPKLGASEVGDIAQTGIGQSSILATPIQMALVAQTVANDGVMMKPMLVSGVMDEGKVVGIIEPERIDRIISSEHAAIIKDHMKNVVNEGTGKRASVSGYQVSGKTGTAEHGEGKNDHSWFIGFAPYDNPQIAFSIIVEESQGKIAASIAREIVNEAINQGLIK